MIAGKEQGQTYAHAWEAVVGGLGGSGENGAGVGADPVDMDHSSDSRAEAKGRRGFELEGTAYADASPARVRAVPSAPGTGLGTSDGDEEYSTG